MFVVPKVRQQSHAAVKMSEQMQQQQIPKNPEPSAHMPPKQGSVEDKGRHGSGGSGAGGKPRKYSHKNPSFERVMRTRIHTASESRDLPSKSDEILQ